MKTVLAATYLLCMVVDDGDGAGHMTASLTEYSKQQCLNEVRNGEKRGQEFWCVKREQGLTFGENCSMEEEGPVKPLIPKPISCWAVVRGREECPR